MSRETDGAERERTMICNIYENDGWWYVLFVDGEVDHGDALEGDTVAEAAAEAAALFPDAEIVEVEYAYEYPLPRCLAEEVS